MDFSTDEWIDAIVRSTGLDPAELSRRYKLFMLCRLIPFCERNYNLVELGPKGTGKSRVFSELSPHGILISRGDVTRAKHFFNNSTKQIGLVGFWVIANALVHAYYGGPITVKVVLSPDPLVVSKSGTMIIDRELALAGGTS